MSEAGNQACSWPHEPVLYGGEAVYEISPLWHRCGCVPRIVNVMERSTQAGSDLLVKLEEFFSPIRRQRDNRVITRSDARTATRSRVWKRNQIGRKQRLRVGVDRSEWIWLADVVVRKALDL